MAKIFQEYPRGKEVRRKIKQMRHLNLKGGGEL